MTRRFKAADLPEFDAGAYLDSETAMAAYLTDILEANNPALLASALRDIARARGMSADVTRDDVDLVVGGESNVLGKLQLAMVAQLHSDAH